MKGSSVFLQLPHSIITLLSHISIYNDISGRVLSAAAYILYVLLAFLINEAFKNGEHPKNNSI